MSGNHVIFGLLFLGVSFVFFSGWKSEKVLQFIDQKSILTKSSLKGKTAKKPFIP